MDMSGGDDAHASGELSPNDVAIIGMSGRWPGARSVAEFWQNMRDGRESVSRFTDAELEDAFPDDIRNAPDFVRVRPIIEDPDKFDARFFGMLPREAALTDPQHRIFLECAWECIEDAGYDHSRYDGSIGVFAGCSMSTYFLRHVLQDQKNIGDFTSNYQVGMYPYLVGALTDTLTTRVAYKLNLSGPAATVHTACSTSLFAIAQAWQSLLLYQCDMAVAGGVSITFPQKRGYQSIEGGMVSEDGHCRPFDADASGTLFGDGACAILLKRLEDAIADGDRIYAVLKGCGVNNDGSGKVGFTAPSVDGQATAIEAALAIAGTPPATIGYVECHGTATPVGDPIEFEGLLKAFGRDSGRGYCALGSGKANIGHVDAAAGVSGLIRAALALHHCEIPPLLNFKKPNPNIDLANSPFYVPTEVRAWPRTDHPRRAGVSSFGVGGTNVHAVLEEAPADSVSVGMEGPVRPFVFPLSGRSDSVLAAQKSALARHLETNPELPLADVAYTLQTGRREFSDRTAIVCRDRDDALAALRAEPPVIRSGTSPSRPPRIIFMFPGQGAQYIGMGLGLYENEPVFKHHIDRGAELLNPLLGEDIREILFSADTSEEAAKRLNATRIAQPALFLIEYATAELWMSWGIKPNAMVGHSIGEFTAAALSGALSFEGAIRLVAARGSLMQSQPAGAMLAVRLPEAELRTRLGPDLDIAAINAPSLCVASGTFEAIDALEKKLGEEGINGRRLHTSHAFHSHMMDPAVEALAAEAAKIPFGKPAIYWASCVSGTLITEAEATSPDYWGRHCRAAVRFADALLSAKGGEEAPIVLEVGPGVALSKLAPQILGKQGAAAFLASLPDHTREKNDEIVIAESLAKLWIAGTRPDWLAYTGQHRRVSLPTYPFERQRHWIDAPSPIRGVVSALPQIEAAAAAASISPSQLAMPTMPDTGMIEVTQTSPNLQPGTTMDRKAILTDGIIDILAGLSDEAISQSETSVSFPELGFDSLFLGQFAQQIQNKFRVKITFRQLLGDIPSIEALAAYLDQQLPADAPQAQAAQPAPSNGMAGPQITMPQMPATAIPGAALNGGGTMQQILQTQMQLFALITQQLQNTQGGAVTASQNLQAPMPAAAPPQTNGSAPAPATEENNTRFQNYRPGGGQQSREMTEAQLAFFSDVVARYNAKTPRSKSFTAEHRPHLADPRAATGFRTEWKDLVYPLVCPRSKGSKIWDLDGNEYIDLVNGFGQTAFGHAPDFVQEAVIQQVKEGFAIGPQTPLAGEVAAMIAEMVDAERVTFCNTGSEAVMAAMRVARTVTGRDKVVVFNNDYHGQFDEVLVKSGGRARAPRAVPVTAGIPLDSVSNMVVLHYGAPESLDWIRANANELAAVIVEPIQSRHPELRPVEFLKELRKITEASETAYVFDEVVTGFRIHPGGVQAVFDIRADMATYGKVLGGGMPVGILAGKAQFMDALDGGQWRFGDDSVPEIAPTFFAGTFVRHPLVLAACKAVLEYMKREGPSLQERLASRTGQLVEELNADFAKRGVSTHAEHYSSWFMVNFGAEDRLGSIIYPYLRLLGIHTLEGFPCFLTTAHSEADYARIADVFREALDAVQSVGILQGSTSQPGSSLDLPREAPLTEVQKEVWMAAQLGDEASCAFNESICLRLNGPANIDALRRALNDVVSRHDSLRASFGTTGEQMFIADKLTLDLPVTDFSGEADPEAALKDLIDEDAHTPFDLAAGPLVRAIVAQLGPEKYALIFTAHHVICDGWSVNIVVDELSQCYAARLKNSSAELPPAMSYARYARDLAAIGKAKPEVEAYWLEQFKTVPALPELPTDRQHPARKSFNGSTYSGRIDAALYKEVKKAGARQGCTLFATLFSAFQVTIGRLADHNDVVIAVPTAGQSLLEGETLVGHCVNFLPLRVPFDFAQPYSDHLQAVKRQLLEAFDRQEYTFGTLVRKLAIRRDMSRLPLTELQFNLERVGPNLAFEGVNATITPNPKAFSNFDMFFNVIESDEGLEIECDYNTDIFDETTIERWVGHFRTLLQAFIADPKQPICAMPLLSTDERNRLLDDLNQTQVEFRRDAFVHTLISEQAMRTPDKIAVEYGAAGLTFSELEARSNRLARYLQKSVPQPHSRIAVALDRSLDMLIALLAVMKAGHTYVPLDPDHPPARLRLVLDTAEISGVICNKSEMAELAPAGASVIRLDEVTNAVAGETGAPLANADDTPNRAAYVIFTSGSTGTPKGVEVPHSSVVNFLQSMARTPGFTANDTIVAVTTISFDIAVLELYLPLIAGGRVVIASKDDVTGGFGLADLIASSQATVLQATPSLWRILLEANFKPQPGLKMLCGGEPLPRDLADDLLKVGGELWNMYGPTETTVWSSTGRVEVEPRLITIGEPIANTQLYILDDRDQVRPTGVPGHLYIGGDGLANGYFNRSDLTEQSFRLISLDGRQPQRLYRTGDLASRPPDGSIQMLGRIDQQVKLRGFRIELEDIEAALRTAPGVAAAAVALRPAASGDARLVCYYIATPGASPSSAELAAYLSTLVPDYMIPTAWQALNQLPITPNGKLDRKALPELTADSATSARTYTPPSTPMEITLGTIWTEVLGIKEIGIHDTLFSLGADSLQLFRIAARMAYRDIPLQAKHLLQHPTIAELAVAAQDQAKQGANGKSAIPSLRDFRHGARRRAQIA